MSSSLKRKKAELFAKTAMKLHEAPKTLLDSWKPVEPMDYKNKIENLVFEINKDLTESGAKSQVVINDNMFELRNTYNEFASGFGTIRELVLHTDLIIKPRNPENLHLPQ